MRRPWLTFVLLLAFGARAHDDGTAMGGPAAVLGADVDALGGRTAALAGPRNLPQEALIFHALDVDSGVSNLSTDLTINGTTVAASFAYRGQDADASTWTAVVGDNLPKSGSGTLTANATAPLTDGTTAAGFPSSNLGYGEAAANTGFPGTDDFVVEVVAGPTTSSGEAYFVGRYDSTSTPKWLFYTGAAGTSVRLIVRDSSTQVACTSPALATVNNAWNHYLLVVDRSGSAIVYTNGVAGTACTMSTATGDLSAGAQEYLVGTFDGSAASYGGRIAWVAGWQGAAWLDTHEQEDLARKRFAKLAGSYPTVAKGQAVPTTDTRASVAYVDIDHDSDGIRRLFKLGAEWVPRVGKRAQATTGYTTGALIEGSSTNFALQSQSVDAADWTKNELTVSADAIAAPDGTTTADGLVASATSEVPHYISDTLGSAAEHVLSVWVKAGAKGWVALATGALANSSYFNVSTCTAGTVGSDWSSTGVESWGSGWCRVWGVRTMAAGAEELRIYPAEADSDVTYTGDGSTVDVYVWGVQLEQRADDVPSSYVLTTTASATRSADDFRYKGGDGNTPSSTSGSMEVVVMVPGGTGAKRRDLLVYGNAALTNDRSLIYTPSGDQPTFFGENAGSTEFFINPISATDITDGDEHTIRATYAVDDAKGYLDTVAGGTDTTGTAASSFATISAGNSNGSNGLDGLVRKVRIWKKPRTPTEAP